jgi:hypothetical protein
MPFGVDVADYAISRHTLFIVGSDGNFYGAGDIYLGFGGGFVNDAPLSLIATPPLSVMGSIQVKAGGSSFFILDGDGSIHVLGLNGDGHLGLPGATETTTWSKAGTGCAGGPISNAVFISTSDNHFGEMASSAILSDSTVLVWGSNDNDMIGGNAPVESCPMVPNVAIGLTLDSITYIENGTHLTALMRNGNLCNVGHNQSGGFGDGTTVDRSELECFLVPNLVVPCVVFLPVELINFQATAQDNRNVALTWQTVSEKDNDYFEIYKSTDLETWEYVSSIDGAGNSTDLEDYSTNDITPFAGLSYYKLTQVDFNGTVNFGGIRSVEVDAKNSADQLSIYPNPTKGKLKIIGEKEQLQKLQLFNSVGQPMEMNILAEGNSSVTIDISNLDLGVYLMRSENKTYRVIKK